MGTLTIVNSTGRLRGAAATPTVRTVGSADEYAEFYLAQFRSVARTVYLIVGDREQAQDIAQDAFVRLYLHWSTVAGYDAPQAWVRRVAIRMATRAVRRERMGQVIARRQAPPPVHHLAPADIDLMRATARLPARQRAAVVLFYYEDRPVSEVAELLGCSTAAAKVTLHRARQALAASLSLGEEVDDGA